MTFKNDPRALPELHARLIESCDVPEVRNAVVAATWPGFIEEEQARLSTATLFYASAEIVDQVTDSAELLVSATLTPDFLPAERGFMLFGRPLVQIDMGTELHRVVAVGWGPETRLGKPGARFTFYSPPDVDSIVTDLKSRALTIQDPQERLWVARRAGDYKRVLRAQPLGMCATHVWVFDIDDRRADHRDHRGRRYGQEVVDALHIVRATWAHMAQKQVIVVEEAHAPKTAQKRLQREGRPLAPVRVLGFSREFREAREEVQAYLALDEEARRLTGRHYRRGHWWGPCKTWKHVPLVSQWRPDTIVGPEDGPLDERPTVYQVV